MKGATYGKGIFLHRRFWNLFRMILWPLFWLKYVLKKKKWNLLLRIRSHRTEHSPGNADWLLLQQNPFSTKEHPWGRTLKSTVITPQYLPLSFLLICIFPVFYFLQWTCTACITKTLTKFSKIKEKRTHKGILSVTQPKVPEEGNRRPTKKRSSDEVSWKTSS